MNDKKKKVKALGLCSGGLDSTLAGLVLKLQGIDVVYVSFETPFFSAGKARRASEKTGIPLIVADITDRYLPMLKNPPAGYGQHMNPCMDCHAMMFRVAGDMMQETGADFLFSGEVAGQRPMSQTKSSLRYVEKQSGYAGLILRPLSAKRLPETEMEKKGLVDRDALLDFSGRTRKPQIRLARQLGITDYPAPAGGCLLTDPNYSRKAKDLLEHMADAGRADFELLKYGRHIRLSPMAKLVVGRNMAENSRIISLYRPRCDVKLFMKGIPGPVGLIPRGADDDAIKTAAGICAGYGQARESDAVQVHVTTFSGETVLSVIPIKANSAEGLTIL